MIKVIKKEELKTKIYLEKNGFQYAIVVTNKGNVTEILEMKNYYGRSFWNPLKTKSIYKVFGVQRSVLLTQLGFIKSESIVIGSDYGEV